MPTLRAALRRVYAIPGVADVLRPIVEPLMTSIGNLSKEPV